MAFILALLLFAPAAPAVTSGSLVLNSYHTSGTTKMVVSPAGVVNELSSASIDGWPQYFFAPSPDRIFLSSLDLVELSVNGAWTFSNFYWPWPRGRAVAGMAPMNNGDYLIAQPWTQSFGAGIIRVNAQGSVVATYALPVEFVFEGMPVGPYHIELLSDQCTVMYVAAATLEELHLVRRHDICTRQELSPFAELAPSFGEINAVRQLPGGDILVATDEAVLRYSPDGALLVTYPYPARYFALTPNASGFWAVEDIRGVLTQTYIRRIDFADPTVVAFEADIGPSHGLNGFAVVSEWRASAAKRSRAARR